MILIYFFEFIFVLIGICTVIHPIKIFRSIFCHLSTGISTIIDEWSDE